VERAILGCKAAVIEANHDVDMLKNGLYPRALKMRILGSRGHLSNETCGNLAVRLAESGTRSMLLAHLSHENNTPDLAFEAVFKRLGEDIGLEIAPGMASALVWRYEHAWHKNYMCGKAQEKYLIERLRSIQSGLSSLCRLEIEEIPEKQAVFCPFRGGNRGCLKQGS
jgi:hypothetical protein